MMDKTFLRRLASQQKKEEEKTDLNKFRMRTLCSQLGQNNAQIFVKTAFYNLHVGRHD